MGIFNSDIVALTASNMGSADSKISAADVSAGNRLTTGVDPTDCDTDTASGGIPSSFNLSRNLNNTAESASDRFFAEVPSSGRGIPLILKDDSDTHMFSGVIPNMVYFARIRSNQGRSAGVRPANASTSADAFILDKFISVGGGFSGALREACSVDGSVAEGPAEGGPRIRTKSSEGPSAEAAAERFALERRTIRRDTRERPAAEAAAPSFATAAAEGPVEGPADGGNIFSYHLE